MYLSSILSRTVKHWSVTQSSSNKRKNVTKGHVFGSRRTRGVVRPERTRSSVTNRMRTDDDIRDLT